MTRNQRKKAYIKCLDLMERGKDVITAIELTMDTSYRERVEVQEILLSAPFRWWRNTNEDDKNFICLCIALCEQPL
jgi:hypothetical protein